MLEYDIFLCRKCGSVNAGRIGALTFTCPHCGTRNAASKSIRLATKVASGKVQETMAKIKMERGISKEKIG
jgi:ribosomal protein L37AE/L43A